MATHNRKTIEKYTAALQWAKFRGKELDRSEVQERMSVSRSFVTYIRRLGWYTEADGWVGPEKITEETAIEYLDYQCAAIIESQRNVAEKRAALSAISEPVETADVDPSESDEDFPVDTLGQVEIELKTGRDYNSILMFVTPHDLFMAHALTGLAVHDLDQKQLNKAFSRAKKIADVAMGLRQMERRV